MLLFVVHWVVCLLFGFVFVFAYGFVLCGLSVCPA